jgi:periplasmic divalent cation tolerance protein
MHERQLIPCAVLVQTTVESREKAEAIGRTLVEMRLAACAQVSGPVSSTYWWRGQLEVAEEWLCQLKTRPELATAVERAIRGLHPYQVPEIVVLPILSADADYLAWIQAETRQETHEEEI